MIRGASSILAGTQPGVEAGAAYFVDGIYYQGDISSIDMSEVQRVEVIKGPNLPFMAAILILARLTLSHAAPAPLSVLAR
ncbi:MAG: TonB-dependent receptor plug domain-containing protein [Hyphomonadaceae bacterium]|nr:TonB-dependent receptor plug domain-containing protein [Hyphomonadaceae bacterium]